MPAIPIFKDTPINASKATGATPQTEEPQPNANSNNAPDLSHSQVGAPAPALAPSSTHQQSYPPAQPGAAPSLPVQTASAQAYPALRPTPTQKTDDVSPPPPQPGAAPVPVTGTSSLPPPPKAGYQQDVSASEFSSHQRAAHHAAVVSSAERGFQTQSEEGVWDTAKKWAQAAGGSLAAAEQEVWKRINKD
ncbi:hypothetical protein ColLi_09479 [Colletotrichum liriopes]|uniref:Uncharacterized protein n=1 Tax=Colletotrichum liriopes TaxID=708192 RepID=A0AA37GSV8_9PEZI|nr:hypothetical protein ColLi_09479 [Colletotrichum liriopes]